LTIPEREYEVIEDRNMRYLENGEHRKESESDPGSEVPALFLMVLEARKAVVGRVEPIKPDRPIKSR